MMCTIKPCLSVYSGAFIVLMLLFGCQEGHLACKNFCFETLGTVCNWPTVSCGNLTCLLQKRRCEEF